MGQFGQEPRTNAEIKAFVERYVTLGAESNVILFAKSNVNSGLSEHSAVEASIPGTESADSCAHNDSVYRYLLAKAPPHEIKLNFETIIIDATGVPVSGEKVLAGRALDPE